MTVFDQKCQFLTKNDDLLIKYAYFLKNKSTKRRGGVPLAKIKKIKNDLLLNKCPEQIIFMKITKMVTCSRICLKRSGRGRRQRRRKNFPRPSKSHPPLTQGQHIP